MFSGVAVLAGVIQLALLVGMIVFAVKLLGYLKAISLSQQEIARSQAAILEELVKKQNTDAEHQG